MVKELKVEIKIANIIVTSSVGFMVNIQEFARLNDFDIDENYPSGVHCKSDRIKGLVTLLRSGKMISTGTNNMRDAKRSLTHIIDLLNKQRKKVEIPSN